MATIKKCEERTNKQNVHYARSEVLTAMKMSMANFWVVVPAELVVSTDVSEKQTAPIFRANHHRHHKITVVNDVQTHGTPKDYLRHAYSYINLAEVYLNHQYRNRFGLRSGFYLGM
jgi:hypothetical protein